MRKDRIDGPKGSEQASVDLQLGDPGRRWLLKAAIYVAPAIISAVTVRKAHAQASCGPSACPPGGGCGPTVCAPGGPCGPDNCPPGGGPCGPDNCPPGGGPCGPDNCPPNGAPCGPDNCPPP